MDYVEESRLRQTFVELCGLKNRQERPLFLGAHPELCLPDSLSRIAYWLHEKSQEEQREQLDLLARYASMGPEVLDQFFSMSELKLLFVQFCEGFESFDERRPFLESHPELLSDKAGSVAERFIDECKSGVLKRYVCKYQLYRNLLQHARQKGIADAFEQYGVPSEEVIAAINTLFTTEHYGHYARALVARNVLSKDKAGARKAFNYLRAKHEGDAAQMRRMQSVYEFVSDILDEQQ